jgi:hypothetical protein
VFPRFRRVAKLLATGLIGLGWWKSAAHAGDPHYPVPPRHWAEMFNQQAQEATSAPFAVQVANGQVLDQTLWGYHFKIEQPGELHPSQPGELHPSGMNLLDRLSRQVRAEGPGACLRLYLQRSQLRPSQVEPAKMIAQRDEQDRERIEAIHRYLAGAWPDIVYVIEVHDPHPVGMTSEDATAAFNGQQGTSFGYIPSNFRVAAASSKGSGSTEGGTLVPVATSQPGLAGPQSYGNSQGAPEASSSPPP